MSEAVRFEEISPEERARLAAPPQNARPLSEAELVRLRDENMRDIETVGKLREQRDQEISKVDRDLPPQIREQRAAEIARRYAPRLDGLLREVGGRSERATGARAFTTRAASLRDAVFDKDPTAHAQQWSAWSTRLSKVNDSALVEFARKAASDKNLALASVLHDELSSRGAAMSHALRMEAAKTLGSIETPAERIKPLLDEVADHQPRLALIRSGSANAGTRVELGLMRGEFSRKPNT